MKKKNINLTIDIDIEESKRLYKTVNKHKKNQWRKKRGPPPLQIAQENKQAGKQASR